jgi:hypothetical protein
VKNKKGIKMYKQKVEEEPETNKVFIRPGGSNQG